MNRDWLIMGQNFVLLLLLQIVVFDAIHVGIYLNLQVYLAFILFMTPTLSGLATLFLSALMGLSVDLLSGTQGMHTAACILTGYVRYHLLSFTSPNSIQPEIPSAKYYFPRYFTYTGVLILLHHVTLFMLDSFSLDGIFHTLIRIIVSATINFLIILTGRAIVKKEL